jgi:Flp pilus assembly protein TadG
MVHITGQVLQTAVTDASRLIMTGQAQNSAMTKDQFKTEICKRVTALFNCNSLLQLDVQTPTGGWAAATIAAPPVVGGVIDSTQLNTFNLGTQGSIVVVRAMIAYPIIVPLVGQSFVNLSGNKLLIMASAAFQNEPYS